jgi:amino acid adenylation domain-containing protein
VEFQAYLSWPDLPGVGNTAPVAFEFEPDLPSFAVGDLRFSILRKSVCVQPFKLNLHVGWNKTGATAEFQYGAELTRPGVERISRYYERLLDGLLANPLARISTVEILDEAEVRHFIVELNQTRQPYPSDQCIHQLFEAQVERTPTKPAVVFRDRVLSYAEFNAAANRLAHFLRAKGVKAGTKVGLCLNRGADMLIALFGILKAGGAYVPLFPEHPKARRAHQLAETESPVLVTQAAYLDRLPDFAGEIVCVDRDAAMLAAQPETNPTNVNTPKDLIYVMYTSGSTGVPKGVATRHENVVNYTSFVCRKLGLPNDDLQNFALVSYLTADLGKTSIFPPLVSGACVHVIGYDESVDGGLWADYVARHRIDVLKISPSHINALLASATGRNVLPREYLIVGGEFFTWDMVRRVRKAGNCKIVNHYAPTEVTIGCLMYDVDENDPNAQYAATVPMGRPISNVDVYILDQHRRPVPLGVPGEIYIGGDGLSNGYVNQPAQTAERFVSHPFCPGKLVYRSGDRGRYLLDGNIESLGRADNQVKIRGFRVELAEIEAALSRHPSVRQAVVIAPEVQPGDRCLSAFVLTSGPDGSEDLRAYLRERLPDYMIPGEVRILDTLPLLPNGKTDRVALAALAQTRPEGAYAAPRNHVEKVIAKIWSEVLDRKEIGVHDNFFELGGHSLIATTVISRLRTAFDIELPLRTIFEHSTVAELAGFVQKAQQEAATAEEIARALAEVEELSEEEVRKLLNETEC